MSIRVMLVIDIKEPNDRDALARVPHYLDIISKQFATNAERMGKFTADVQNKMMVAVGFQVLEPEPNEGMTAALLAYAKHIEAEQFGNLPTME